MASSRSADVEESPTTLTPLPLVAIVQARMGSTRLPGKVLKEVVGLSLIGHLIERLSRAPSISMVVLALPESHVNDDLAREAERFGARVSRGSELDVLERYANTAKEYPALSYLRVTGDCPLVDPDLVEAVVALYAENSLDYACTGLSFPDGLDLEMFSPELLNEAAENARDPFEREHVTPYMKRARKDRGHVLEHHQDLSALRLTVDEPEDFEVIEAVFGFFGGNSFSFKDVTELLGTHPQLFVANRHILRNEGSTLSTGEKLWRRAKKVIPGGSMLLSKKSELYSQKMWPSYFSRSQGCRVWDLEERPFLDVGFMGVGTNILGYGYPSVDEAVHRVVESGNLTSLNAPEEVELAELLCDMHPWAGMARFTRSGGEACAVAVRIARATSGKDGVAVCGYHGWHDWYLSANLSHGDSLQGHLLPGLEPRGVPGALAGMVSTFEYNQINQLEEILARGDVGTIFMEVERNFPPLAGFLESVRALATKHGAVLVFDECTSGFREVMGGMHLKYGVNPDIAVFGKTLGNGYAINAIIGRPEVMKAAEDTFISSTFWTERIGSAAALASLKAMRQENAPERVHKLGGEVRQRWQEVGGASGLSIISSGLPALSTYLVEGYRPAEAKTFIIEHMLAIGYLAPPAFYASIAHSREIVESYMGGLGSVFQKLSNIDPVDLLSQLPHGVAQSGFARLN